MGKEKEDIESEYQTYVEKYGKDGMEKVSILFAYLIEAMELRRQDFLGHVQEELGTTRGKDCGQFYTPDSVATFMARVTASAYDIEDGKIIKICDPSCGAGALLIAGAEALLDKGARQGDLLVYGEDIDPTACNIFYVQATLLGYAARVTRMDSLPRQVYEGPWYTAGYFMHGMPMRLLAERSRQMGGKDGIEVRSLVQGEFNF